MISLEGWIFAGILCIFVAIGALIVQSENEWARYSTEHHCAEVSRAWRGGYMQTIPMGNGQTMSYWVDQGYVITYKCDNGFVTR
jgi:hypothetical protein